MNSENKMVPTFSFRLETSTTDDIFITLTCGKRNAAAVALIIAALAVTGLVAPDASVVVKPVRNGEIPVGDANASKKFHSIRNKKRKGEKKIGNFKKISK